jgi:hypothetical protein
LARMPVDDGALIQALAWHAALRTGALDPMTGGRLAGAAPLAYVDKNPWGRHLDDQSVARNVNEALGMSRLVELFRSGRVRLAYSTVSFSEGVPADGSESASRVALREVITLGLRGLPLVQHDQRWDTDFVAEFLFKQNKVRGYDAIHAAAALLEGAWYFVTGDDQLRRRLNVLYDAWSLPADAVTPDDAIARIEAGSTLI